MMESDPAEIKRLGKSISRNPAITSSNDQQHGLQIMERALISKFSNPRLRSFLLATRNKKIIEASYDKFWGSEKGLYDKDCLNQATPCGENHQGALLVKIRESIDASLRNKQK